ncbi:MAG TPA: hypothetical protein DCX53_02090 [Anaerolineae bacterium]|nr:hypothetical protein [Anaerolineae bacterium]
MNNNIGLRIVSVLVLIAAIAGIGFFAYQAGVAQGSPITIEAPSGETSPAPYPHYGYGYGMRFHHPFGFGFGCFGLLIPLFLFFLALKAARYIFWGRGWSGHHGYWGRRWEGGAPSMFHEWHKRAHDTPEEKKE